MSLPVPYYEDGAVRIYHGDCREVAGYLAYEAVVSDPPYGMGWDTNTDRFSGGKYGHNGSDTRSPGRDWGAPIEGDHAPFDPSPWLSVEWCVLWGYHHFAPRLPTGTVLVWLKRHDELFGTFLSDCELAWRMGGHGVYAFRKPFAPPSRRHETSTRFAVHPTQKPVALMEWSIERSGAHADAVILDPFMGSGTTLVAAKNLGRKAIGIEIDEKYCEIAARRLCQEVLPLESSL